MKNLKKKTWTVIFLVKSIDGTINDVIRMINELCSIQFDNEISIVLCLHVAESHLAAIESGDVVAVDFHNLPEDHITTFYKIGKVSQKKFPNGLMPEYKHKKKNFDITNPADLLAFFKDCILKDHVSERYMLFTWGHGSCYGIFKDLTITDNEVEQHFLPQRLAGNTLKNMTGSPIKGVRPSAARAVTSVDVLPMQGVNSKYLAMETLRDAIAATFGEQKIDIVAMMNCYMQFFDAGYALANVAKYLVAPETYMYFEGYNYSAIFSALAKDPAIEARTLCEIMVRSFEKKILTDREREKEVKDNTALFANDLSCYPAMSDSIYNFHSCLDMSAPKTKQAIFEARSKCAPLNSGTQVIDFGDLVFHLKSKLTMEKARLDDMSAIMKKIVIAEYVGDLFKRNRMLTPSGFSVFFPFEEEGMVTNFEGLESYEKTDFFSNGWGKFISHFRSV